MNIQNINHAKSISWKRDYYTISENEATGELSVKVRTLNIFQRILRFIFGSYSNTILSQKTITDYCTNNRSQRGKIEELVQKLNNLGKKIILPEKDKYLNVLIVGRSRGGKTTMVEVLKNPFHIAPQFCKLEASTEKPELQEHNLNEHTVRFLDTPGLFENWADRQPRTTEEISGLICEKANEIFQGKALANVDVVMMTFSHESGINQADIDSIDHFLPLFTRETKKLLVVTRAEAIDEERKNEIRDELTQIKMTAETINTHFGGRENILFTGAFPEDKKEEADYSQRAYINRVVDMGSKLWSALLPKDFTAAPSPVSKEIINGFIHDNRHPELAKHVKNFIHNDLKTNKNDGSSSE